VLLRRDHQTCLLQESHYLGRFSVNHMSPFMALICQDAQRNSKHHHPVEGLEEETA